MNVKYDLENLLNVDFPFRIEKITRHFPNIDVVINGMNIFFKNYSDYNYFGYCMKRQYDLGLIRPKTDQYNVDDLKDYLIFDSGFNLIQDFTYAERLQKEIDIRLSSFTYDSEKCFWGSDPKDDELSIDVGQKELLRTKFIPQATTDFNTKAMIQPDGLEYDESYFVYIDSQGHRPDKFIDVAFLFHKSKDRIIFDSVHNNNWIY